MTKISAKDGVIVIGGYSLSPMASVYDIDYSVDTTDVTGFNDTWHNSIPGDFTGSMNLNMFWDSAANSVIAALKPLGTKCVTVIPDGFVLGNPCFTMQAVQQNFTPSGAAISGAIQAGNIVFLGDGVDAGPLPAYALAHATITDTTTSAAFDMGADATQRCAGVLHVWTPCAADTYVVKIRHCDTAGGTYADLVTFTLNGSARASEKVVVASFTIEQYLKVVATRTGANANPFGYTVAFWHAGM